MVWVSSTSLPKNFFIILHQLIFLSFHNRLNVTKFTLQHVISPSPSLSSFLLVKTVSRACLANGNFLQKNQELLGGRPTSKGLYQLPQGGYKKSDSSFFICYVKILQRPRTSLTKMFSSVLHPTSKDLLTKITNQMASLEMFMLSLQWNRELMQKDNLQLKQQELPSLAHMFPRRYKGPDSCEAGITAITKLEIKKKLRYQMKVHTIHTHMDLLQEWRFE